VKLLTNAEAQRLFSALDVRKRGVVALWEFAALWALFVGADALATDGKRDVVSGEPLRPLDQLEVPTVFERLGRTAAAESVVAVALAAAEQEIFLWAAVKWAPVEEPPPSVHQPT
jgi:hypothetical protein